MTLEDIIHKKYMTHFSVNKKNLNNIVRALNMLGTKPDELLSILQLMKRAGCLNAKLEVI